MQFELVTAVNADAVYVLQNQCQQQPWSESAFHSSLTTPYFAYALIENTDVIGFYIGHQVVNEVTLMDIGVAADKRGHGIGAQLLNHFEQQAKVQQAEELWLEVRVSNQAAIALYQRAGFELINTRKQYYQTANGKEDALIMRKLLKRN